MQCNMLRAKSHRATVTQADLDYESSCGTDEGPPNTADICKYEKTELYNVNNGEHFSTYIIKGKRGSGEVLFNGAAAHHAHVGDLLIICTHVSMSKEEVVSYRSKVVLLGEGNKIEVIEET